MLRRRAAAVGSRRIDAGRRRSRANIQMPKGSPKPAAVIGRQSMAKLSPQPAQKASERATRPHEPQEGEQEEHQRGQRRRVGQEQIVEERDARRSGGQQPGEEPDPVAGQFAAGPEREERRQRAPQPLRPVRMSHFEKGSDPRADAGEITAGKTSLVDHVHLVEQFRQLRIAGVREPTGQKRFGLQQVAELVVIGGWQVAEARSAALLRRRRAKPPRRCAERRDKADECQRPGGPVGPRGRFGRSRGCARTWSPSHHPAQGRDHQQQERQRGVEMELEEPGDDTGPIEPGDPPAFELSRNGQCQSERDGSQLRSEKEPPAATRGRGELHLSFRHPEAC